MSRVIFTTYDDIEVNTLIDIAQQRAISEYFDRLIDNKKQYAELCNADFQLFHNSMGDWDCGADLDFTKVNLYKHHLMATLAEQYDEVMYVDMDVLFNTTENIFEEINLSKGIAVKDQNYAIKSKDPADQSIKNYSARNPTLKYHITRDLLSGKDNNVLNTGLMVGRSEHIKQVQMIDRLPKIIKAIDELKFQPFDENNNFFNRARAFYYPNNEAAFSYILENYNIPFQLLDEEWHTIVDDNPINIDLNRVKILHLINKLFHFFFEDKTQVVYTMHIEIDDESLDDAGRYVWQDKVVDKSKNTKHKLKMYYDQLLENKKQYAEAIGADFIFYERDDQYETFKKRFPLLSEYDVINLYKIGLMDQLVDKYDHVLYMDFDVYVRNNINIFDTQNCEDMMQCAYTERKYFSEDFDVDYVKNYNKDFRNPHSKYWNTRAMLLEDDLDVQDGHVYNTGIMAASKPIMEKLAYFDDIDNIIDMMTELKNDEFSMFPENIRKAFGYDNETIMSYVVAKNNVPVCNMKEMFHFKHTLDWKLATRTLHDSKSSMITEKFKADIVAHNPTFVHFISKQFELAFDT